MSPIIVDFRRQDNASDIARALSCAPSLLETAARDKSTFCERHEIPKKDPKRGHRTVYIVTNNGFSDALKAFSHRFEDFVRDTDKTYPLDCVHGYVKGRSILTNARAHLGATHILKTDIKNFFPSISSERVQRILLKLGLPYKSAELLARIITIDGHLPLGFPSSPIIANLACQELDQNMLLLAKRFNSVYTRYSDDLTFSSRENHLPPIIDIKDIVSRSAFQLAERKTRIKKRGQAFYVTGLSIADPDRPRIPRLQKRALRQEMYYIQKFGLKQHLGRKDYASYQTGVNQIFGRVRFISHIEPHLGARLRQPFEASLLATGMAPSFAPQSDAPVRNFSIFVDESIIDIGSDNSKRMMVGITVSEDGDAVRDEITSLTQSLTADPFLPGRKDKIIKHGIHWTDLHEAARTRVIERICVLPLRFYAAFAKMTSTSDKAALFLRLLRDLLAQRFPALDGGVVEVIVEEGSGASNAQLQATLSTLQARLVELGSRRPHSATIRESAKQADRGLAVPDVMLGALGQYLSATSTATANNLLPAAAAHFERLRPKYRVITNADTGRTNTRRNPL